MKIVRNRKLSDATKAELEKPLIPYDACIEEVNKSWDDDLEKL